MQINTAFQGHSRLVGSIGQLLKFHGLKKSNTFKHSLKSFNTFDLTVIRQRIPQ